MKKSLELLNETVVRCKLCPRLVAYRETVPVRASFKHETYWRKPIPGFGDPKGRILFIGLAPAAHGGNRTGRIFTGDESEGVYKLIMPYIRDYFLSRSLHKLRK